MLMLPNDLLPIGSKKYATFLDDIGAVPIGYPA
jgi:hypothetical protein